jgi:hypothetical protein
MRSRLRSSAAPAAAVLLLGGCALSYLETSRQLRDEEVASGVSLAVGPFALPPRVGIHSALGVGDAGDVSAFAGTGLFTLAVGAGGRFYLDDRLTLGLQGQITWIPWFAREDVETVSGPSGGVLSLTPRLTTSTTEDRFLYGGVQAWLPIGTWGEAPWAQTLDPVLAGVFVGAESMTSPKGWRYQLEVAWWPAAFGLGPSTDAALARTGLFASGPFTHAFVVMIGVHGEPRHISQVRPPCLWR